MNVENDIKQVRRLVIEGVIDEDELRNAPIVEIPEGGYITTQEAADLLNTSHPYLLQLIEAQEISCEVTNGQNKVVLRQEVIEYKQRIDELTAEAEQYDMGYEPPLS